MLGVTELEYLRRNLSEINQVELADSIIETVLHDIETGRIQALANEDS